MNKQNVKELLLYGIVGAIATVAEWVLFFVLDKCAVHYMLATAGAYVVSTFVNWGAGRLLVFKESKHSFLKEIAGIYAVSLGGLLLNLGIMWLAVDVLSINEMLSKMAATAIVFFYNFFIRKRMIYKK